MATPDPNILKIGQIPFLVCAPFFHRFLQKSFPGVVFKDGPPRSLNQQLRTGEIHLAPSSSIEYARHHQQYRLLPRICTSSTLEIRSVALFSRYPLSKLEGKKILLTSQSDTSVMLLKVLLEKHLGLGVNWTENTPPQENDAQLLIGDQALQERYVQNWPHIYDLATLWQNWQQLPFVFGAWIVHENALNNAFLRNKLHFFQNELKHSLRDFRQNPAQCLKPWLQKYPTLLPLPDILEYHSIVDYHFTSIHQESLSRFFELSGHPAPLRWTE